MTQLDSLKNMSKAEFDLYCGLLKFAYKIEEERTGLVCAAIAEDLRDRMYDAMQTVLREDLKETA